MRKAMRSMRNMSRLLAPCALALACLALGLRIVAPQGYMVAQAGEARALPIVLCTGQGLLAVVLDDQGRPDAPGHDNSPSDDDHVPCAFAATGTLVHQASALSLFAVAYAPEAATQVPSPPGAPGRGLSAPPPPQTGPPVQV